MATMPAKGPKESGRSNFNLKVWFYDFTVDTDTGEVMQKEFVYVGKLRKRMLAVRNIKIENELDVLLFILHQVQAKCEKVICYDNNKAKFSPESVVFQIEKGIVKTAGYRLDKYECNIKKFIPHYKIIPHEKINNQ